MEEQGILKKFSDGQLDFNLCLSSLFQNNLSILVRISLFSPFTFWTYDWVNHSDWINSNTDIKLQYNLHDGEIGK